jgi:hypothetical protein
VKVPDVVNECTLNPKPLDVMFVIVPPVAIGNTSPVGTQVEYVPSYHSVHPSEVLYLIMPATGLAGRCAVVPEGNCINPVSLIVVV